MKEYYSKENATQDSIEWQGYLAQRQHLLDIYHRVSLMADRALNFTELFWIAWACGTPAEKKIWEAQLEMLPYQKTMKISNERPNDLYLRTFKSLDSWYVGIGVAEDKPGNKKRLETLYKRNKELHTAIYVNTMKKMTERGFEYIKEEVFKHFDADVLMEQLGFKTLEALKEAFGIRPSSKRISWPNTGLKNENGTSVKGVWQFLHALDVTDTIVFSNSLKRNEAVFLETMYIEIFATRTYGYNKDHGGDNIFVSKCRYGIPQADGNLTEAETGTKDAVAYYSAYTPRQSQCKKLWFGQDAWKVSYKESIYTFVSLEDAKKYCDKVGIDLLMNGIMVRDMPMLTILPEGDFTSFRRGTYKAAFREKNVKKVIAEKYSIYLWKKGKRAFWWSPSPIIDVNDILYKLVSEQKRCTIHLNGLDVSRIGNIDELNNFCKMIRFVV